MGHARIHDVLGTDHVHFVIELRILERGPHTGPRRQMKHHAGPLLCENAVNKRRVEQIPLVQGEVRMRQRPGDILPLHRRVVKRIKIVQPGDGIAPCQQCVDGRGADKTRRTRHQYFFHV